MSARIAVPPLAAALSAPSDARLRCVLDKTTAAALAVSSARAGHVFEDLVRKLAAILEVDATMVGMFVDPERKRMRSLATSLDGKLLRTYEYDVSCTPCRQIVGRTSRFAATGINHEFAPGTVFSARGFDSYAGYSLLDAHGEQLGIIVALDRGPIADSELTEALLKIFAVRAANELERTRAEQALAASEERYRTIFNSSADQMMLRDAQCRVVDANPTLLALHGARLDEFVGVDCPPYVVPEDRVACLAIFNEALAGRAASIETRMPLPDGRVIDVEWRALPLRYRDQPHVLTIARDITAAKHAEFERRQLELQLRQSQKMQALGQLTGGIAHDFNNLLAAIMGYVVLAEEQVAGGSDTDRAEYLKQALNSCRRGRDLIQQMLTFSRGGRGKRHALSLAKLVHEAVALLRSSLPSTVALVHSAEPDLPSVCGNEVQAGQVLLNLCINARDAMDGHGEVRVAVRRAESTATTCTSCRGPIAGDYVELEVTDTGSGIPPDVIERMFEPFFTTKEPGKGTGMGLSMVHGIVHEHGGHVVVESEPSRGTRFRVLWPALPGDGVVQADSRTAPMASSSNASMRGRLLLVDDEAPVLEVMRRLLVGWGLSVDAVADANAAWQAFAAAPDAYDAVITDQTMPGTTGITLARRIHSQRPSLPIVLYSGLACDAPPVNGDEGICAVLRKPVEPEELRAALERVLAR